MYAFVRTNNPRPTFHLDMTDAEKFVEFGMRVRAGYLRSSMPQVRQCLGVARCCSV